MQMLIDGTMPSAPGLPVSETELASFLRQAVEEIEMTLISGPHVERRDGMIAGLAILAESHISIHIVPSEGRFFVDVFSCKPFARGKALQLISDFLTFETLNVRVLDRGNLYESALAEVATQRQREGLPRSRTQHCHVYPNDPNVEHDHLAGDAPHEHPEHTAPLVVDHPEQPAQVTAPKPQQRRVGNPNPTPNLTCKACGQHVTSAAHKKTCGHTHRWKIDPPDGPFSKARCLIEDCEATTEFANSQDSLRELRMEDSKKRGRPPGRGRRGALSGDGLAGLRGSQPRP